MDDLDLERLLPEIYSRVGNAPLTALQLLEILPEECLPLVARKALRMIDAPGLMRSHPGRSFGKWLATRNGYRAAGYVIDRRPKSSASVYVVTKL